VRVAFFIVVVLVVLHKMRGDAAWATAMGVFVYFAIPSREFYMPTAPYQAVFFGSAVLLSIRTRDVYNEWVKGEVRTESHQAAAAVYDALRAPFVELICRGVLDGRDRDRLRAEAQALTERTIDEVRVKLVPAKLERIVRPLLTSRLEVAATVAVKEAERMLGIHAGAPPRNFLATMIERVTQAVDASTAEGLEAELDSHIATVDVAHERATRMFAAGDTGFLGIPMPSGGLIAVFSNSGIWFHFAFIIATAATAQTARYDVALASAQIDVVFLLLIPLAGIMLAIRTAEQFRLFLWSWIAGVSILCYNGVTMWLAHGGRADSVGGQAGDANWLGIIAVSVAPICISMVTGERKAIIRFAGLMGAGLSGLGIIACGSRGALIAVIVGVAYWFVWTNKKGLALSILLTGGAAFLVVAPEEFWERMGSMFLSEKNPWIHVQHEASAEMRKRFWVVAREVFAEKPWTGIGPKNYPKEVGVRGVLLEFNGVAIEMECHSTWLHLLAEYGIWGFIWIGAHLSSFFMIFRAMVLTRRLKNDPQYFWLTSYMVGIQGGWIGAWVAMSFVSSQWYDFNFWIFIVGPMALQIARHTIAYREWFELPLPTRDLPPPRYGPPAEGKLDLTHIDVSDQPALRPQS